MRPQCTHFSRAWPSEGTVDPFPFAYMLEVDAELSRTCQAIKDDTDLITMATPNETCQTEHCYWSSNFSSRGETRNSWAKYHMICQRKAGWRNAKRQ